MHEEGPEMVRSVAEAEAQELKVPDFERWFEFAHTLNGYHVAEELEIDIGEFAQEMRAAYDETGRWQGTRLELRVMLFYLAREIRFVGGLEDDQEHLKRIRELLEAIRDS